MKRGGVEVKGRGKVSFRLYGTAIPLGIKLLFVTIVFDD